MNDHDDKKLAELFKSARSAPRPGWEARAISAMLHTRAIKSAPRFRTFAVAIEVSLVMFALGLAPFSKGAPIIGPNYALAAEIALAEEAPPKPPVNERKPQPEEELNPEAGLPVDRSLDEYKQRAVEFVKSHYPNDADMLMAAGLLTTDDKEKRSLLKAAAMKSKKPVAWVAYAGNLLRTPPPFMRPGLSGLDPEDKERLTEWQKTLQESHNMTKLSQDQAAPHLEALRGWEAADPQNALPVALQVYLLYGLHKDAEARATWQRAGNLPLVKEYFQEMAQATARLLNHMGMGKAESVLAGTGLVMLPSLTALRQSARIAFHEGRLAQIQGRPKEAIEWWNATINLGIHMQDSATSLIPYLVSNAMEAIGAAPTWKWYSAGFTQTAPGPLNGGSIYYGRQHAFYVSQVGKQADAKVRDRLVLALWRKELSNKYISQVISSFSTPLRSSNMLLVFSRLAALALLAFVAIFAALSLRARGAADEAANLRTWARAVILLLIFLPLYYAGELVWKAVFQAERPFFSYDPFITGSAISLAILLVLPFIAALFRRRSSAGLITTWRGNLRKLLPAAIVLCAVISLGLGISGRIVRSNYIREWYSPTYNEMAQIKQFIGPEWDHPKVPAGAWHAAYPPKRP